MTNIQSNVSNINPNTLQEKHQFLGAFVLWSSSAVLSNSSYFKSQEEESEKELGAGDVNLLTA